METKRPVITLLLDHEILSRLDDYWHNNRFPNRSAAVKKLLDDALPKSAKADKATKSKARKSNGS